MTATMVCRSPLAPRVFARSGFTLIELIVVLVLLSVILAMVAPSLRGWGRSAKVNDAARDVLATATWARSAAISTAVTHRLEIAASDNTLRVSRQEGSGYVPAAGEFGNVHAIASGLRIDVTGGAEGGDAIEFYPNGRCTPATIRISAASGEYAELAAQFPADTLRRTAPRGAR